MKRRTVRVRLTAVYSGLFLLTSAAVLVTTNLLLKYNLGRRITDVRFDLLAGSADPAPDSPLNPSLSPQSGGPPPLAQSPPDSTHLRHLPDAVLSYQWSIAGITVAVLTIVSIVIGWWLAGRLLRPVHQITATARRLSLSNLNERIVLAGPRDELTELADTFDSMLERIQRSVNSQRRFIANASHELRTPLAIQRAAIEIGLDNPSPERLARVRDELLEVNRRNERLIDSLLILAQGENGLETTEPVDLDVLVRQAISETPANGILIRQDTEPATVTGDPVLLHRLVANLVHNAIRYNRPGGVVDIRVTPTASLTVRNTGPEIPESRIGELFEPFRRLHTARTGSADSAGLGLSIVAAIARAHAAEITTRPNPGGGLQLTVQFPASAG
ncbi:HAMP domain-containing sensor histidine kinase [Micromonospora sp. NPDC050200]|uniref:sensor histidine kinase n=1 Tax=Micromonospora sp. NPDC050200 TaxID=3155664 RepID=UPI003410039D